MIELMTKYENKITGIIIKYIYKIIITKIIEFYKIIKKLIKILIKFNYMYKNDYKKFFFEVKKEIFKDLLTTKIKFKKICLFLKYFLKKYIFRYSFIKFCKYFICNLDLTNLKLHIYNKLDIYDIFKNNIKYILNFITQFIIYMIDKYYNKYNKFQMFYKFLTEIKVFEFDENFNKLEKLSNLKDIKMFNIKKEIDFLITIVKSKFKKNSILLNHVDDFHYTIFIEE